MKKLLSLILGLLIVFCTFSFTACDDTNSDEKTLKFFAPDGAPALSIAKFINDNENFIDGVTVDYNVVSADVIGATMTEGQADLIVMPINAASKLYNAKASDPYKMVSVVTHGNLFLMSSQPTTDLEGLKGKVVGVFGQGLVPDLTFKSVLKAHNLLDDVKEGDSPVEGKIVLSYYNDEAGTTSLVQALMQGKLSVGLLPEPACTNLTKMANNYTWNRIDIQELYDSEAKAYPQAVLMVKSSVLTKYPTLVEKISEKFDLAVQWVVENPAKAVNAIGTKYTTSLNANNISDQVVENCKIKWLASSDAKEYCKSYINKILDVETVLDKPPAKALNDDFFA